jgi:hypothetical protein
MQAVPTQSTEGTITQGQSPTCRPQKSNNDPTCRTKISDVHVCIYAWPSKGGVIILDHAERVDLEFLDLDPLDPPTKRLHSQKDEDEFCQRLLLLGAKWWDSEDRHRLVGAVGDMDEGAIYAIDNGQAPVPTLRERRWVSVAWPTTGGLWVAEFDTSLWGIIEKHNVLPPITARLKLAHTMDERSQILQDHFKAKFYKDVRDYKGYTFLNSWEEKETGEVGPLKPLRPMV